MTTEPKEIEVSPSEYAVMALPAATKRLIERLKKATSETTDSVRVDVKDLAVVLNMVPRLSRANTELREELTLTLFLLGGEDLVQAYIDAAVLPGWIQTAIDSVLHPEQMAKEAPFNGPQLATTVAIIREEAEVAIKRAGLVMQEKLEVERERSADPNVLQFPAARALRAVP